MKVGDIVYIVPRHPKGNPHPSAVWYVGATRFSAGGFTFVRSAEGDQFLGSHSSAYAYSSALEYTEMCEKRDAWQELRYIVANTENPPRDLSVMQMQMCINLLKGKQ